MTENDIIKDKNLRAYLTGDSEAFAKLCRKFVKVYYPRGPIRRLWSRDEWVDIWATVYDPKYNRNVPSSAFNPKWSRDAFLFRFFRGRDVIDDLKVRDFFGRVRGIKADRGVCVSAGALPKKPMPWPRALTLSIAGNLSPFLASKNGTMWWMAGITNAKNSPKKYGRKKTAT